MNAKTVIAAVAAVSVAITLAACGDSTKGAAPGSAQDAIPTTVASSIVEPGDTTGAPTATVPSTTDVAADTTPKSTTTTVLSTTVARPTGPVANSFRCTAPDSTYIVTELARRQWC